MHNNFERRNNQKFAVTNSLSTIDNVTICECEAGEFSLDVSLKCLKMVPYHKY